MDIVMIGIDHEKAPIKAREIFSFTRVQAKKALENWKTGGMISGGLLLSTCNRTELWISGAKEGVLPEHLLCNAKNVEESAYKDYFVCRRGGEAVSHLLQLICGLKSRIYGEDQIVSQVREGLEISRLADCDDMIIEKVFQSAVSAAKKVKTQVRLQTADPSAARNTLLLLKEKLGSVKNLSCLIIGNGQMGKLVANVLVESGAQVTMTLRKKFHGKAEQDSIIPDGCHMIDYEDRHQHIDQYKAVISATISPHFTVKLEDVEGKTFDNVIWIDMAVPRDMEAEIGQYPGIDLYDMDRLGDVHMEQAQDQSLGEAMEILQGYEDELERWFAFRQHVGLIKEISFLTTNDIGKRIDKQISQLCDADCGGQIKETIETASEKAVEKLLFGLRDTLDRRQWEACLAALEQSAQRDTLKTGDRK